MPQGRLEHANISVTDPARAAALLIDLLGWHKRWEGPAMNGGHTIHVGDAETYLALYTNDRVRGDYDKGSPLNHVAFVVDDLATAECVVTEHGLKPFGHDDYDPGRRFYFFDWDGIEFEVVSYE
ncbi:MAG: VOC family protein [Erythrobacter sp.]|nr:VOC family protein [Erythrobacter sp.]NCQ64443.1 VOC family protein [Alphaproteobacteria bacterium]